MNKKSTGGSGARPPYPRFGEILQLLANAFGTKARNRDVDRLARDGDFDWRLPGKILEEVFEEPLTKYADAGFARRVVNAISRFHKEYVEFVTVVQVDALSRDEALPILVDLMFAPWGAGLIRQEIDSGGGPVELLSLLRSEENPLAIVLRWASGEEADALVRRLYPASVDSDRENRGKLYRWIRGKPIPTPDLGGLQVFVKHWESQESGGPKVEVSDLKRWLLIARAVAFLEKEAQGLPMRQRLIECASSMPSPLDCAQALQRVVQQKRGIQDHLALPGLMLFEDLKRTTQKLPGAKEAAKQKIEEFAGLVEKHDPEGRTRYYLEWVCGRWQMLSGAPEAALPHYLQAAELANYRAGVTQKEIVQEALVVCAVLKDKVAVKQLKHRAIVFGLFQAPAGQEDDVVENWEMEFFAQQVHALFPGQGRFIEAAEFEEPSLTLPSLVFDEKALGSLEPDLKNPEKIIRVNSVDGRKRRWPQLRMFAGLGKVEAVKQLLAAGADVNRLDEENGSALLCAIQYAEGRGDRTVLNLLLGQKHTAATVNSGTTRRHRTPLFAAISYGEPDVVKALLGMGAQAEQRNKMDGMTPLYYCISKMGILGNPQRMTTLFVEFLLHEDSATKRDAWRREGSLLVDAYGNLDLKILNDPRNRSRLFEMAYAHFEKERKRLSHPKMLRIARLLLENGANPNARHEYPTPGRTPMLLAAENDDPQALRLLMDHGGDPYQPDNEGCNCQRIAIGFGSVRVMNFLKSEGLLR